MICNLNIHLASAAWDAILGLCVGNALGLPAEFADREVLRVNPVKNMRVGGVYGQPAGTWSCAGGMTLCHAAGIAELGLIYPEDVMRRFVRLSDGEYAPHGRIFDMGAATKEAIARFISGTPTLQCGGGDERDNDSGAITRILPAAILLTAQYGRDFLDDTVAAQSFRDIVAVTHAHPLNLSACLIYADVAAGLLQGDSPDKALARALRHFSKMGSDKDSFARLWKPRMHPLRAALQFKSLPEDKIQSGGCVVHTLEAALWCLLNTDSYDACVLKAVNLGNAATGVSAAAGGLAGLLYGAKQIPSAWIDVLARRDLIFGLCDAFQQRLRLAVISSR